MYTNINSGARRCHLRSPAWIPTWNPPIFGPIFTTDYLAAVNRAWQRGAELQYQLFPVRLEESLPCITVPLRDGLAEPPLDLQYVFQLAYDGGPYTRGAVDYDRPPDPPLRLELADWMKDCLERRR